MSSNAYVFPGQGSQFVGMLGDLGQYHPQVLSGFHTVSERIGYDLWELVQQGPFERLNQTEHTQVAMLVADVVVYQLLQQQGVAPAAMMAGHSLGEYAALVCAGAIDLPDAAVLVQRRGQLMQEAVPMGHGSMAAIVGLDDNDVAILCERASTEDSNVTPANYNAIGQVVIAGHTPAVQKAIELAHQMGARMAIMLPVSVPCHCSLLEEASSQFEESLADVSFQVPKVPVISNVDLSIYTSVDQIRRLLKQQLYQPVLWVQTIQLFKQKGITQIIECGPGKVLAGLIKRIDKSISTVSVNDALSFDAAVMALEKVVV